MNNQEMKSTTTPLRFIVKIAIALTAINTWILFEEIVVDRHGLWGMYQWLDRAPKGRNEEDVWWRRHDEYNRESQQKGASKDCCG